MIDYKYLLAAFCLGVIATYVVCENSYNDEKSVQNVMLAPDEVNAGSIQHEYLSEPDEVTNKILELEQQVLQLTKQLEEKNEGTLKNNRFSYNTNINDTLTKTSLLDAGIDELMADEIIRRKEIREFAYLELHDKATREGYIKTVRYRKEAMKLKNNADYIRRDLGDSVYDKYLYAANKNNRIVIKSVMINSPAEYSGLMSGDIIFSYDEHRVFTVHELSKQTTLGRRDESIILNVERDNEVLNILIPRGPLGVKLDVRRVIP